MKIKVLDSICGSGKSYYARHSIINGGTGKYIKKGSRYNGN